MKKPHLAAIGARRLRKTKSDLPRPPYYIYYKLILFVGVANNVLNGSILTAGTVLLYINCVIPTQQYVYRIFLIVRSRELVWGSVSDLVFLL